MTEEQLQIQVADYLRLQYPDILFHSDFGSGAKLTINQASRQKRLNGGKRAWPDLFIAARRGTFGGLFIELKRDGVRLFKRNGEFVNKHIEEQDKLLRQLRENGYIAKFCIGFDEAKCAIDDYLGGGDG